jgi:hypothetical protein
MPVTIWPPVRSDELSDTLMIFGEPFGEGVLASPADGVT